MTPQETLSNLDEGANCETTAYLISMLLGKKPPPPGTRVSDFLEDPSFSSVVEADIQTGDIIGQQKPERTNFWGTHLSVAALTPSGEVLVVHNVSHIGYLTVQPLDHALSSHPTHTKLVAIRRLPPHPSTYNPDALRRLGLGFMLEGAE